MSTIEERIAKHAESAKKAEVKIIKYQKLLAKWSETKNKHTVKGLNLIDKLAKQQAKAKIETLEIEKEKTDNIIRGMLDMKKGNALVESGAITEE